MFNLENIRKCSWEAMRIIGAAEIHHFGGTNEVTPNIELMLDPVKVGSNQKLDDWVDGVGDDAAIAMVLREVTREQIEHLCPWFGGTSGTDAVDLAPAAGQRMRQWAKPLILHPTDANGLTNQDIEIYATVPVGFGSPKRDGKAQEAVEIEMLVYPDLNKLLANQACIYRLLPNGPAGPTNLAAEATSATEVGLTWTSPAGTTTNYEIWQSTSNLKWTRIATPATPVSAHAVTGLTAATRYMFRVRPMNSTSIGGWSNPIIVETPAA